MDNCFPNDSNKGCWETSENKKMNQWKSRNCKNFIFSTFEFLMYFFHNSTTYDCPNQFWYKESAKKNDALRIQPYFRLQTLPNLQNESTENLNLKVTTLKIKFSIFIFCQTTKITRSISFHYDSLYFSRIRWAVKKMDHSTITRITLR